MTQSPTWHEPLQRQGRRLLRQWQRLPLMDRWLASELTGPLLFGIAAFTAVSLLSPLLSGLLSSASGGLNLLNLLFFCFCSPPAPFLSLLPCCPCPLCGVRTIGMASTLAKCEECPRRLLLPGATPWRDSTWSRSRLCLFRCFALSGLPIFGLSAVQPQLKEGAGRAAWLWGCGEEGT